MHGFFCPFTKSEFVGTGRAAIARGRECADVVAPNGRTADAAVLADNAQRQLAPLAPAGTGGGRYIKQAQVGDVRLSRCRRGDYNVKPAIC